MSRIALPVTFAPSDAEAVEQFAFDISQSLAEHPRRLPSQYLYDALGSALFDAICQLPWYGITRAETRLLAAHGADVLRSVAPLSSIVELGPGGGEKLRLLLEQDQGARAPREVHLVDVSATALAAASHTLESVGARVSTHQMRYEDGLEAAARQFDAGGRALVVFLGSNIGNYHPPDAKALVRTIREALRDGDALLLGTDLVKPPRDLVLAYDDPLGVTAAFNRNLLARINRELGGDFDLSRFAHVARWNDRESRIEMHLVSQAVQNVRVPAAGVAITIEAGERIWTESSYKYRSGDIIHFLEDVGFGAIRQWVDRPAQFALTLAEAV